jgi:hypothetical protein
MNHDPQATAALDWRDRTTVYQRFWQQMQPRLNARTDLYKDRQPPQDYYWATQSSRPGFTLAFVLSVQQWARVDLQIATSEKDHNKIAFDLLLTQQQAIEAEFAAPLHWERLETKRASRISYRIDSIHLNDPASWPELQEQLIEVMIRLERTFHDRLRKLNLP